MNLRLLDEVVSLDGRGILLLTMDEENAPTLLGGCILTDAKGSEHTVSAVVPHDDQLFTLYLPSGEASYFERLFRDVMVDATLFTVTLKEEA
ncbi:MAG: hypothetical protein GX096_09175 [Clostridiales bacterium]|nr:hypothetical protein [Clostridiales bacterium]